MTPISVESLRASIGNLPALPSVVMEIIESMGRDNVSGEQLGMSLLNDQALTAKTLRLANSSFYGVPRQVSSIQEAITILGLRTVRSVVMASALASSFDRNKCGGMDFDAFWRHAIGTALCARGIAQAIGMSAEVAFMVGLLHDVGQLALVTVAPAAYEHVVQYQMAHACLSTDHAAIGGMVTRQWCFAPDVVDAVSQHHNPPESVAPTLTGIVHVADNMAHALDLSHKLNDIVPPISLVTLSSLKLKEEQCLAIFSDVQAQHEELCRALLSQA